MFNKQLQKKNDEYAHLSSKLIMCLDLETTGLDSNLCEITEVGASFFRLGTSFNKTYGELVKIENPVPNKITEITGITNEMLKDCNPIETVLTNLNMVINQFHLESNTSDLVILCQNAKFDIAFLTKAMLKTGISIKYSMVLDTRTISKHIFPDEKKHALDVLCDRFNVTYDSESHHRAVYDTEITRDIFLSQINNYMLSFDIEATIVRSNVIDPNQLKYLTLLVSLHYEPNEFQFIVNTLNFNTIVEHLTIK